VFIAWYNLLYSFRRDDFIKILRRKGWNKNASQDKISSLSPGFQIVAISSQTKSSLVTRTALAFGWDMPSDVATAQPRAGKPRLDLWPVLSSLRCLQQPTPRLDLLSPCLAGFFRCTPASVDSFAGCSSPPAPHGSGPCGWRGPRPRHPRACSPAWLLPTLSGPGFGSRFHSASAAPHRNPCQTPSQPSASRRSRESVGCS
jgi:hypothetical protein